MSFVTLGRSGLKVSRTCLGTMTFGNMEWGTDEAESGRIVDAFVDAGIIGGPIAANAAGLILLTGGASGLTLTATPPLVRNCDASRKSTPACTAS